VKPGRAARGTAAFSLPNRCAINGGDALRGHAMTTRLHRGDLPDLSRYGREVAIDTETMGLDPRRDRLCVVQLSPGDGSADVVQIPADVNEAPNLQRLFADPAVTKIFHYARFDMAVIKHRFGVVTGPVYCTKIASRLCRTYTDRHGLKDLVRELLNIDLSKQQQSSDWGSDKLSDAQLDYAASDVLYLHDLKRHLDRMLRRENRMELADACFRFLPTRIALDLLGWQEEDIFAHS
jgi:ribonuclease D